MLREFEAKRLLLAGALCQESVAQCPRRYTEYLVQIPDFLVSKLCNIGHVILFSLSCFHLNMRIEIPPLLGYREGWKK